MAASQRSLRLTELYRARLFVIRQRLQAQAERAWPTIEGLDSTDWPNRMAAAMAQGQREAVRVSAAYLQAFIQTETGQRFRVELDPREYAGKSRDGRPLTESLRSPLIATFAALKEGLSASEALSRGLNRALRMVETDTMHAGRESLRAAMENHPQIDGWQRAVNGTCGACLGDIAVETSIQLPSLPLHVHPNCQCVTQPVVTGVPDRFPLLSGQDRFKEMSAEEQDAEFGPEKAEALRNGEITLADLVEQSELATDQQNFITEKPLSAVQ